MSDLKQNQPDMKLLNRVYNQVVVINLDGAERDQFRLNCPFICDEFRVTPYLNAEQNLAGEFDVFPLNLNDGVVDPNDNLRSQSHWLIESPDLPKDGDSTIGLVNLTNSTNTTFRYWNKNRIQYNSTYSLNVRPLENLAVHVERGMLVLHFEFVRYN